MAFAARNVLYVVSIGAHLALGGLAARVKVREDRAPTTITMRETRRRRSREETPPPPPPPPPPPVAAAAPTRPAPARAAQPAPPRAAHAPTPTSPSAPAAPATDAPASNGDGVPEIPLAMSGGIGGDGTALPSGDAPAATPQPAQPARPAPRPVHHEDECTEDLVRARPIDVPPPEYPDAAREAGIEGRVRVEITVDSQGHVRSARVIQGLGFGLDEAALEAARRGQFEAATRCGHAVESTFTIGIRFTL